MQYKIETTNIFDKWFAGIKNVQYKARIISRFDRIQMGNFGDNKPLGKICLSCGFFSVPDIGSIIHLKIQELFSCFVVETSQPREKT